MDANWFAGKSEWGSHGHLRIPKAHRVNLLGSCFRPFSCLRVRHTFSKKKLDAVLRYTIFVRRARWVGAHAWVRLVAFGCGENSFRAFFEFF